MLTDDNDDSLRCAAKALGMRLKIPLRTRVGDIEVASGAILKADLLKVREESVAVICITAVSIIDRETE